jgi:hypothetical protein
METPDPIPKPSPTFEELADRKEPGFVAEFVEFLGENKRWWLLPIVILLCAFGILATLASSGVAPFIYTLF